MVKKTFIFICVHLFFSHYVFSQNGWIQQSPLPVNNSLFGVQMLNCTTAYSCGTSGCIIKSNDGGNSWEELPFANNNTLQSVHFINSDTGFSVGGDTSLYYTTDGGNSWNEKYLNGKWAFRKLIFTDSLTSYILSEACTIIKTTDQWQTWTIKPIFYGFGYYSISDIFFL